MFIKVLHKDMKKNNLKKNIMKMTFMKKKKILNNSIIA